MDCWSPSTSEGIKLWPRVIATGHTAPITFKVKTKEIISTRDQAKTNTNGQNCRAKPLRRTLGQSHL
jgi:hypothetical protein